MPIALDALLAEEVPPIDHVDLFLVRLPFVSPFAISTAVWTTKDALLLRLESGGLTAWGECVVTRSLLRVRDDGHGTAHPEGLSDSSRPVPA